MSSINIKLYYKFIILLNFLFLLSCNGVKEKVGIIKTPPDEFQVYKQKPLVVPPNFELRPPIDKELTDNKSDNSNIIFKEAANIDESLSIEDEVLLISIGDKEIDEDIRHVINTDNDISEIDKPLLDKILDFDRILEIKSEEDTKIDPNAEKERIDQLKLEGKLIDAKEEKIIIKELKTEIDNLETELNEVESINGNLENLPNLDDEINQSDNQVTKEEKSLLDKIFDFNLFSSEDEELEIKNQRDKTFFTKKKAQIKDSIKEEEKSNSTNKHTDVSNAKDVNVEAVISEKEGSID